MFQVHYKGIVTHRSIMYLDLAILVMWVYKSRGMTEVSIKVSAEESRGQMRYNMFESC